MKTTVYLVRHGQALGNLEKRWQGITDAPLSPLGQSQLDALAERCRELPLEIAYTSPLVRAAETCKAACRYHKIPIYTEPGLIEMDGGAWEWQDYNSLCDRNPEAWDLFANDLARFPGVGGGESTRQVYDRMVATVNRIINKNKGKTILLSTHGMATRIFLGYCLHLPFEQLQQAPYCPNVGLSLVEFDERLQPDVVFCCDGSHVGLQSGIHYR